MAAAVFPHIDNVQGAYGTVKISTIITTHNRSAWLRQAIESVLAQEPCGAEVELIVVDDDSSDDTPAVVASYPSVRYLRTKQGKASGSREVGIARASGEWIAFLDDDDAWLPHKLKECCRVMRERPEARFITSAAIICDHELRPAGGAWLGPDLNGDRDAYDAFLTAPVSPSVVVMHRDVLVAVGLFDPSLFRADDFDLWLRVASSGVRCASTDEPLVLYREREWQDGRLIHRSYRETVAVLRRSFAPGNPWRPSWRRRRDVYRHYRGWYTHRVMQAAREARERREEALAARLRSTAFNMSPLHAAKSLLTDGAGR